MLSVFVLFLTTVFFSVVSPDIASSVSILTVPRSSVVKIGDRVELKCSAIRNVSVIWLFTPLNSSSDTNVYLGGDILASIRSRYKIDNNISGQHNLIIDSVDLAHAGRYRCTTIDSPVKSSAQLTVLDSSPKCSSNTSSDDTGITEHGYLWMWCRISYTGSMIPVFSWSKDNAENAIIASDTSRELLATTSSVLMQVYSDDNGATFKCKITFQLPNNTETNPPDYEYTWNYTTNVTYGPRNLSIVRDEDRLVCSSDGNPTPTYQWRDAKTNTSTNGNVLKLNDTYDKEHTFQCIAKNAFGAKNEDVTVSGRTNDSGGIHYVSYVPITALAIGGSLLFLLIIAIIVSCSVHRKRRKDDTSDRPDVALNTDLNLYDDIALSSDSSPNYILDEDRLTGRSDGRTIVDNVVYSEVCKPKGRSNGSSGGNPGENSRSLQTPTQERKNLIGADGTEYAELSRVKPPARKGEVPKPPAFSRVEVYASIDHNGRAPPPPPKL